MQMDMDMSSTGADYSDYEYQHIEALHRDVSGESENRTKVVFNAEPLESASGLDVNEVAELVAIRWHASLATDAENANSQSQPGTVQFRGVVGANLDALDDFIEPGGAGTGNRLDDSPTVLSSENATASATLFGHDKSEVFDHFNTSHAPPFADASNGTGGGTAYSDTRNTVNFRELTGRGPVLDANDEISILTNVNFDNVVVDVEGTVRVTLVWDTATVDDAGRKFSVPE